MAMKSGYTTPWDTIEDTLATVADKLVELVAS